MRTRVMEADPVGRARAIFINLAVAVGALAAVALLAELAVRAVYGKRFAPRPGFYVADPLTGWRPARSLDHTFYGPDFRTEIITDANGTRLGELGPVDLDEPVVILSGDSFVFGWGVDTDETYASALDRWIHEVSGGEMRVINLGVGGYGLIQSYDRLLHFIRVHHELDVRAVILHHAPNDPADNLSKLGYHLGRWEPRDRVPPRSSVHVVNLATQLWHRMRRPDAASDSLDAPTNPHLQDMLFAFERYAPDFSLPAMVNLGGVTGTLVGLEKTELEAASTLANQGMSERQRFVMKGALALYSRLARRHRLRIYHTMVPTAPDWYVDEIHALIPADTTQIWLGRILDANALSGPVLNDHSGGHYTPEVNRLWAEAMAGHLIAAGLGGD